MKRTGFVGLLLLTLAACSTARGNGGFSTDDAGDAATSPDAMEMPDASQPDAPQPDASQPDVSQPDVSQPDVSQPDVSQPDVPVKPDVPATDGAGRCTRDSECSGSNFCDAASGACVPLVCSPGRVTCINAMRARVCDGRGAAFMEMDCPGGCASNVCSGGTTCSAPMAMCGGVCVNTQADPANCGACGRTCTTGQTCVTGVCTGGPTCTSPMTMCGGVCVNTLTDTTNCGFCGRTCTSTQTCTAGICTTACVSPMTTCSGACVNTQTDMNNCGACGRACTTGQTCRAGTCSSSSSNYTLTTPPSTATFVDACALTGAMHVLPTVDDSSVVAPLPFSFPFWGMPLPVGHMVSITSNGYISLDGMNIVLTSGTIPATSTPNGVIAAFWRDLYTQAAGVCYATTGSAPNRSFVVEWSGTRLYPGTATGAITTEIVLREADGSIDIFTQSNSLPAGSVATVGVENIAGTRAVGGCTPSTTYSCASLAGTRLRFTPSP